MEFTPHQINTIRFFKWLIARNGSVEIRLFQDNRPYFGYFDQVSPIYKELLPVVRKKPGRVDYGDHPRDGEAEAVYFTLNPYNPALIARSHNKIVAGKSSTSTSDNDIENYRLLLIDCDSIRPTGISSSKEDKRRSGAVMRKVYRWLTKRGIQSIPADSGNGFHLLVPVNYSLIYQPKIIKLFAYLHATFSTPEVKIDTTTTNPSRVCKAYGTKVCKGSDMPNNPHRYSSIHINRYKDIPDQDIIAATADVIDYESSLSPSPSKTTTKTTTTSASATPPTGANENKHSEHVEMLRDIIQKNGDTFREKTKGDRHIFEFEVCPVHTTPGMVNSHTYECMVAVEADGKFSGKCAHIAEKGWADFKQVINWEEHKEKPSPIDVYISSSDKNKGKSKKAKVANEEDDEDSYEDSLIPDPEQIAREMVVPIGYFQNKFFFYCKDTKQYIGASYGDISIMTLCSDWDYWMGVYPFAFGTKKTGEKFIKKGTHTVIKDLLVAAAKETDCRITHLAIRETGIYRELDNIIYNNGKNIYVNDQLIEYKTGAFKHMYQSSSPCPHSDEMASPGEIVQATHLLHQTTIERGAGIWLLLGTIFSGYLSGLSTWRSHVWITGSKGSGKSDFVSIILNNLCECIGGITITGNLTEAGLRQRINNKATIVIHDEAETSKNIDKEISLIRISSSGGSVVRGTPNGDPIDFRISSTFILLSISNSIVNEQDKERFIRIQLDHRGDTTHSWFDTRKKLENFFTPMLGARICKRMAHYAMEYLTLCKDVEQSLIEYFTPLLKNKSKNISRYARLFSGPMSAFLICLYDPCKITKDHYIPLFKSIIKSNKLGEITEESNEEETSGNMSVSVWNTFLDTQLSVSVDTKSSVATIREVLENSFYGDNKECLRKYGIYYLPNVKRVKLKNKNQYLIDIFDKIGFRDYKGILKTIPGIVIPQYPAYIMGEKFRGIEIPYPLLEDGTLVSEEVDIFTKGKA